MIPFVLSAAAEEGCTLVGGYGEPRLELSCKSFQASSVPIAAGEDPQVVAARELERWSVRLTGKPHALPLTVSGRTQKAAVTEGDASGSRVFVAAAFGTLPRDGTRAFLCRSASDDGCVRAMEELMAGGRLTGVETPFPTVLGVHPTLAPGCTVTEMDSQQAKATCDTSTLQVFWSADVRAVENLIAAVPLIGTKLAPISCALASAPASRCLEGHQDAYGIWIAIFDTDPPVQVVCERRVAGPPAAECPLTLPR